MASSKAMVSGGGIDIDKLSIEQLKSIKEQSDLELNLLQDSLNNIRTATARLEIASTALNDLASRPKGTHFLLLYSNPLHLFFTQKCHFYAGKKMLVPLTASLYVPGTLDDAEKVLVDVGTGYFIEVTHPTNKVFIFFNGVVYVFKFDQFYLTVFIWGS